MDNQNHFFNNLGPFLFAQNPFNPKGTVPFTQHNLQGTQPFQQYHPVTAQFSFTSPAVNIVPQVHEKCSHVCCQQGPTQINIFLSVGVQLLPHPAFVKQEPVQSGSSPMRSFEGYLDPVSEPVRAPTKVNVKTHSGKSFEVADIFEKANLDYVFNLLQIIQATLDYAFPLERAEVIGDYRYCLQEKGILTDYKSSYAAIKRARNQLSHNDCGTLNSRENVRGLLEKAIAFIHELQNKCDLDLPQLQDAITLQQAFLQHKFTQPQFQIKQLKTKEDLGRILLYMAGVCLGNCARVNPIVVLAHQRERDALRGVDTYYWLKWGTKGFLVRKTDLSPLDSRFVQHCTVLMHQRMFIYHPIMEGQKGLDLWRMFESLLFVAVALGDFITTENLNLYFPLLQKYL